MRLTIITLLLISNIGFSQNKLTELNFDTKYYDAVDNWVVFPKKETDSTYAYGFIYIDQMAGITLRYGGTLKIEKDKFVSSAKANNSMIIHRLTKKTNNVYQFSDKQISELDLQKEPEWLSTYKSNENTAEYLKDIGNHLNHAGAVDKALVPLLKAYKIEPHLKGLEFELSFAYNALKEFNKAIEILEKAIENNPNDYQFYRELGYSYMNLEQIDEAEKTYLKGIKISTSDFEKSEMSVNMAQAYFRKKNEKKFNEWSEKTLKYAKEGSQYAQYIEYFKKEWNKE
ncbi:tetratricopeptide repeat protein [Mesonia algae]|uniref:Tetratricopeptide repeat protein n=1 Tax=Mesonia algae TaxID=213248 RepID=A0A2W7HUE6_9FLAO|nr:tetratricopeptide repeat protein [Mesonia algae]PZW37630.1 tetratricopeptide repeat protein [Mesonia algae]